VISKKLALVLVVISGCGKDGDKGSSSSSSRSGKGGCEINPQKVADLVKGKTVGLPAPLDALSLGMSRDDVAKACPNFFTGDKAKQAGTFSTGEIVGKFGEAYLQPRLELVNDKLDRVEYSLPADIADALAASWGPPAQSGGDKPALAWFDDKAHVRAILEPAEYDGRRPLVVSSYMPLDAFIEPETTRIAWKPQDILGKKPAELAKAYPQYLAAHPTSESAKAKTDELMKDMNKDLEKMGIDTKRDANLPELELPASPFGADRTHVILYTDDDGSVRSYGLWFHTRSISPAFGWPQQSADIVKLLDAKWGARKQVHETLGDRQQWYDATRLVRVGTRLDKPDDMDLDFVRYMPLANLFGAAGERWGLDTQ